MCDSVAVEQVRLDRIFYTDGEAMLLYHCTLMVFLFAIVLMQVLILSATRNLLALFARSGLRWRFLVRVVLLPLWLLQDWGSRVATLST